MQRSHFSVRQKVFIGVVTVYLFMAATILGSHYLMERLGGKIAVLEDVGKLEESVLEIRRFEKNFFLYGDPQSLKTALYHLVRAQSLLEKHASLFEGLESKKDTEAFRENLLEYQKMLTQCSDASVGGKCFLSPETRAEYEGPIRKSGTSLAEFATSVARKKRASINQIMGTTVTLQIVGLAVVGIGLMGVGVFLVMKVTRPLKLLEESPTKLAQGKFELIEKLPPEKEIRDIFESFNTMARQLKKREEQLVQSKKLASLGTMAAGVAHEINNPLSNISSSCEILLEELDEADPEFQRNVLKKVLEQVDKARVIVLNLLEFSRNRAFARESLNLKETIEKTLSLFRAQKPPCVRISTFIDDDLTIFADRQRIEQAFLNLISNACQAIEGEGRVSIRATASTDGMVKVRIKDTGKGISEEDLARIFDPFFTTKDVGKGTGLGLFITHDIVVRHQGSIQVTSTPGQGTTFCLSIPAEESTQ